MPGEVLADPNVHFQLHPEDRLVNNYGIQLIKFLELYGRHFNYLNCGIRVTEGGSYFRKGENSMGDKFSLLCVEDPFNADNDVGQSCFGAMKVREEFDRAFRELCDGVLPQYSHLQPPSTSLLARVLHIAPEVVAYRRFVFERYRHLCHSTAAMTGSFFLPPGGIPAYTQIHQHQQQQQQSMNHFNPHLMPGHHQYGSSAYQPGQGQQLNFNRTPLTAATPVALFQQQFPYQQMLAPDGFQQTTFRYNYPVLSNIIAPPVPMDGIYPNQMAQLQVQPACLEDRSDSDSLSSQHSSQSSQVSQGLGKNLAGNGCNKNASESQQDQEPEFIKSSTPLPSVEPALSTTPHLATVTTSKQTHSCDQSSSMAATTTVPGNKSFDGSKRSDGNSPEIANRSNSSNRLDTLCEITASARHSNAQGIKSSNSYHHQHRLDRHHQSSRSTAYHEESTRSHYVQRANSTKHINGSNKSFPHTASYSGSSPPLDSSSRSSHQSRHGGNRSGTNHKNQTNVSAGTATSSHLVESAPIQRGKTLNNPSSQSQTSNSASTQQHYHRNGPSHVGSSVWTPSHKAARKSNTYPPSSNNFSRNGFKNQKISQSSSSSSSSSSCSPTYSPATMTAR